MKLETDARKARIDELEKDALHDKKIIIDLRGDGQGAEGVTSTDSSRRCKGLESSEFGQVRGARGLVAKKEKAQDGTSVEVFRASQCDLSMKGEGPRCVCLYAFELLSSWVATQRHTVRTTHLEKCVPQQGAAVPELFVDGTQLGPRSPEA